jgi:hypothetical protein
MLLHLTDEQIVSLAMRPTNNSPNTFQRVFQTGLLQVISARHQYLTGIHKFFFATPSCLLRSGVKVRVSWRFLAFFVARLYKGWTPTVLYLSLIFCSLKLCAHIFAL